jgi:hypothetical protein
MGYDRPIHRPALVIVPPTALTAWMGDHRSYFADRDSPRHVQLKTFGALGNSNPTPDESAMIIRGTAAALATFTAGLDGDVALTTRTLVLATLQGFHRKVLIPSGYSIVGNKKVRSKARKVASDSDDEDVAAVDPTDTKRDDDVDIDMTEHEELRERHSDGTLKSYNLVEGIPVDMFGTIIADEAHRLKNPQALQSIAVSKFQDAKYIFITATPFKTNVKDLSEFMEYAYRNALTFWPDLETLPSPSAADYETLSNSFHQQGGNFATMTETQQRTYARALDPAPFLELSRGQQYENTIVFSTKIVPLPTSILVLKRGAGDRIDCQVSINGKLTEVQTITMASAIPHVVITTEELQPTPYQAALYKGTLARMAEQIGIIEDDGTPQVRINPKARRLTLASFNPLFDNLFLRKMTRNAAETHKQ